ncbi:MAG: hypothetical protein US42_C0011G0001 [Candidatus Magasanikbacteria bacterium GW2011_GWC2_37_14]|uniref:Uncharacterized protein n=1 Tax=Candidatus Magasanikbacteria bacterium GW2011_GWC2_37_14 TaxID=1619046 RepID=A0A0G0G834_9BACT|nr:MAG: hypothetical protein US42_C0011G0001 [Candidatus Magasanikbacteria bacterium GW2011_GWC2_37_14]
MHSRAAMDQLRAYEEAVQSPCRCRICGREYYPQRGDEPCHHEEETAGEQPIVEEEHT